MSDTQDYVLVTAARLDALEGVVEAHWDCECSCGDVRRAVRKSEATPATPPADTIRTMLREAEDAAADRAIHALIAAIETAASKCDDYGKRDASAENRMAAEVIRSYRLIALADERRGREIAGS